MSFMDIEEAVRILKYKMRIDDEAIQYMLFYKNGEELIKYIAKSVV